VQWHRSFWHRDGQGRFRFARLYSPVDPVADDSSTTFTRPHTDMPSEFVSSCSSDAADGFSGSETYVEEFDAVRVPSVDSGTAEGQLIRTQTFFIQRDRRGGAIQTPDDRPSGTPEIRA